MITKNDLYAHLVYSEDDNGYYWERKGDFATSQIFPSEESAILSRINGEIIWDI